MKRVLVYSHDTFGLGNIRRMLEIARALVDASPDVSVLVVTGSPMLHAFRIPPRIDYVKLPCLARGADGRYGARTLDLTLAATVRLRANLIRSAIADFEPDLILVDKKPFGVEDELAGALAALHAGGEHAKLVLLLRDILDSPGGDDPRLAQNGCFYEAIEAYYDEVLVVGDADVFDLRREYAMPPFAAAKVTFCGYIARQRSAVARRRAARARRRAGPPARARDAGRRGRPRPRRRGGRRHHGYWRRPSGRACTWSAGPRCRRRSAPRSAPPLPTCPRSACATSPTT